MDNKKVFSILIPTWNNLSFLQLCCKSIKKNSVYQHQILIYINEGTDGTLEWVKENGFEYVHSPENRGVCFSLNSLRPLVKTDYILYMNDDMYVCPQWDKYLLDEILKLADNKFFISSTLIQPRPFFCKSVIAPADYGDSPENFKEDLLLEHYLDYNHNDWFGATWPPNVLHRDLWDIVGGYSIEFSPGMYSDPDFSAKLWLAGVRYFKGVSQSRVYHFESKSTKRIVKNNGSAQFLLKYGITSSSFMKHVLRRGEVFDEEKLLDIHVSTIKKELLRSKFKRLFYLTKDFMTKKIWQL